jgi:3-phosphoshikimate 1-carboxyvinyltransferase
VIVRVPGDKSISQRALIFAALADGESRLSGLLPGKDPSSTARALRALGAEIGALSPDGAPIRVRGSGLRGLRAPTGALDLGNSGTGARLLMGVLAASPFEAVVTGDDSLRSRPMKRVTDPLARMGARFESLESEGRLPIRVRGGALRGIDYEMPVTSAQVKSALLLAGLVAGAPVSLTEPSRSRDHTERMLREVGVAVHDRDLDGRWRVELPEPPRRIPALDYHVPGDFSSSAFLLVAGLLGIAGGELTIEEVGLNPTRTGFLALLARMGASLRIQGGRDDGHEPVGSLTVGPTALGGIDAGHADVSAAIDEIPALMALAARARGTTRVTGAAELRIKETARIRALVDGLRAVGVEVEELEDGLVVEGSDRPLRGTVDARLDHRIAMTFGLLGALPGSDIRVVGAECVDVSFPTFWETLEVLKIERASARAASSGRAGRTSRGPIVTLDGPAGSGKSSTAREVARRLGFRHLDSGALYRALTHALLASGIPPSEWPALATESLSRFEIRLHPAAGQGFEVLLNGRVLEDAALRSQEVTAHVSTVASLPAVRRWLLERQREAGSAGNLVADGRDMGTAVFPDADVKVFLVARLDERSRRRLRDHGVPAPTPDDLTREAERLQERDKRDSEREASPLRMPEDAWELDTTALDFDAQVEAIVARVREALAV